MLLVYVFELQYDGRVTLPCVTTKFVRMKALANSKTLHYVKYTYPQLTDVSEVLSRCIKISRLIWTSIIDFSTNHRLCHSY
jgi:hypothetical protein